MQVLIDNQDGAGTLDYTHCVQFGTTATLVRQLNKSSLCTFTMVVGMRGYAVPTKYARVSVLAENGLMLFAGYLPAEPELEALGSLETGLIYKAVVSAYSLDALLDATAASGQALYFGQSAQQGWAALSPGNSTILGLDVSEGVAAAGRITVAPGARWTEAAAQLADATRSSYRTIGDAISIVPVGSVTHLVANNANGLTYQSVSLRDRQLLASDVTVCGREEPTAYVTEIFSGDGVTANFTLTQRPFEPVAAQRTSIVDLFQGVSLNPRLWLLSDLSGHIALDANGLSCTGGTGREAEATVGSVQQIELGGNTTLEAGAVRIGAGSVGTLLGMYVGSVQTGTCFAGFGVTFASGATNLVALVDGSPAGAIFTPLPGHLYTLRLRLFSAEVERVRQSYMFTEATTSGAAGGAVVAGDGWLEFEVQDVTSGVPGAPTILHAGFASNIPPACFLGLMESGSLVCSMRSVVCSQSGPVRIAVGIDANAASDVYAGTVLQGAAYRLTTGGILEFYPATIPSQGSVICAKYRLKGRAVARRVIPNVVAGPGNATPAPTWIGTVSSPPPWSSVDCDIAAAALLAGSSDSSVALRGSYRQVNLQVGGDMWPGDTISITPFVDDAEHIAVVRQVTIRLVAGSPECLAYEVDFANDWAESLSIRLSSTVPADALLPQQPTSVATALASLTELTIVSITGSVLTIETGVAPPINGGFEIRRRDGTFGPGTDSDLVVRVATSTINLVRGAPIEAFYVRMYDGASPPNYSMFSAALFLNVPLS